MSNEKENHVNGVHQNNAIFTIKDNIIMGEELVFPESHLSVGRIILDKLKSKPDTIAQIEAATGRKCTFREMMEKSIRCAIWLKKQNIKPGDTVAVCSACYFDCYVPVLACFYIGAVCAVEYHKLPKRNYTNFLSNATPKIIFLHDFAVDNFDAAHNRLNLNVRKVIFEGSDSKAEYNFEEILSEAKPDEIENFECESIDNPKEVALLIGTSGSTGMPKLAELSHLSLRSMMHPEYTGRLVNVVVMCAAGLRWITFFLNLLPAIRCESTRIIVEDARDAIYYYEAIKKYKVQFYATDSNQLRQIYKMNLLDEYATTDLKTIIFGGSPFSRDMHETIVKRLPNINVFQCYGSTDVANCITAQVENCKPGSCGYVRPGVKIKIIDTQTKEPLGPNKNGEICAMTTTQMNGYRNNREATKKAIDSEGWLHTGDIGYYDENGEFYIAGRASEFIKYKDCCLSVPEIEAVLDMHPAVYKCAVTSIPVDVDGEHPVAFVMKLPDEEVTERELLNYFESNMPDFYKLGYVKFVSDLPLTNTGKIAKNNLKQMLNNGLF